MRTGQAGFILIILFASRCVIADPGRYAQQLRQECDALVQSATRRPYGWGWDIIPPPNAGSAPRHVTLQPLGTPTAGILLLWSGEFLNEPKFNDAALQAMRAIAAAQASTGMIPQHAIFGAAASGRTEPRAVPDRSATCAGLALMLSILDAEQPKPQSATHAAQRAVYWLMKQQMEDGAWPAAYPSDAIGNDAVRLIRMDDGSYRDSTYAMLLAADVLDDAQLSRSAEKSIVKLLSLRAALQQATTQPTQAPPPNLWSSAYRLNGTIDPTLHDFPAGADALASRCAMQTLLAAYLMSGEKEAGIALDSSSQALLDLRSPDGTWQRIYLLQTPTTAPTTNNAGTFDAPTTNPTPWTIGTFDLPPTLDAVTQLKIVGREKYAAMLAAQFTPRQRLAAALCGLSDNPLTLDLPVSSSEVEQYLQKHQTDFATLENPLPDDLPGRLKRLWLLLIRAKLEQMQS